MTLLTDILNNKRIQIGLIFVVSLLLIFAYYLQIPKSTTFDEIEFAKLALQLGKQGYTPYSTLATGHATLYFYLILLSFKILGVSLFALRLPSAFFGILNPIVLYFVLKMVFPANPQPPIANRILPFILSLVFISMRWYFNFARFGFEVTFLLFLELTSLYFMLRYTICEGKNRVNIILSGIFAGLAYNSYQPGRLFFLVPLIMLFSYLFISFRQNKIKITPPRCNMSRFILPFIIPFMVLILPLSFYLMKNPDIRMYQQFYPDNHEMTIAQKGDFFLQNLASTAGIFHIRGDVNGRHNYPNKPALNPILGIMFVVGIILALKNFKNRNNQLFLFWFLLSLAPTLVTYPWENPNMLRTFTAIPSIVYFIGLSIIWVRNIKFSHGAFKSKLVLGIMLLLLGISASYEIRTYFVHQAQVFKEAFEAERSLNSYLK